MAPLLRSGRNRTREAEQEVDQSAPGLSRPALPNWTTSSRCLNRIYRALFGQMMMNSVLTFEYVFKLSWTTFIYICSLVEVQMETRPREYVDLDGHALSVEDQVAIALRRFSSGDSLAQVGVLTGVNPSTVSHVTWWFVEAMENTSLCHIRWPTRDEMNSIKSMFEEIHGLPNCCGVIDTTNIRFRYINSADDPTSQVWLDNENNFSMALQVVVGPDLRFLKIFSGFPGFMMDFSLLRNSNLYPNCEQGEWLNGEKRVLPDGTELREYLVGDPGFPLMPWLMTPYTIRGSRELSAVETNYNRLVGQVGMVAQSALARLKKTWKFLDGELRWPDKHKLPRIIQACCILHNILIDKNDAVGAGAGAGASDHNPGYRQQHCLLADRNALAKRETLARYLFRVGESISN